MSIVLTCVRQCSICSTSPNDVKVSMKSSGAVMVCPTPSKKTCGGPGAGYTMTVVSGKHWRMLPACIFRMAQCDSPDAGVSLKMDRHSPRNFWETSTTKKRIFVLEKCSKKMRGRGVATLGYQWMAVCERLSTREFTRDVNSSKLLIVDAGKCVTNTFNGSSVGRPRMWFQSVCTLRVLVS